MQRKIDLLHGNLYSALLWFALPFLAANLIQVLYGTVDLLVVGWYNTEVQISAVSLGSQITQLLLSLITGLTMGSTVLIAQYAGNGKEKEIEESIATTFTLFLMLGIVLTIAMMVLTPQLLRLIQTPQEAVMPAAMCIYAVQESFSALVIMQSVQSFEVWEMPKVLCILLLLPVLSILYWIFCW